MKISEMAAPNSNESINLNLPMGSLSLSLKSMDFNGTVKKVVKQGSYP
jgi:hypothetical protein